MRMLHFSIAVLACSLLTCATASAQHQHHHYTPGYHIDHHDHIVRDSHGHIIGQYHHDVLHSDSSYIVPHSGNHHDTYYYRDGGYYYHPQTSNVRALNTQPVQVEFGGFSHVDDLASRLERLTNEFCLDLHYNYSHNAGYAETYTEAYQILQAAKFIHAAEHQQDRQAIVNTLGGLDLLFHHVQDDVRGWTRHQHRQIGQLEIMSKIDLIESTLHHLMNDVGVHPTPGPDEQAPPPGAGGNEQAPPPPGGIAPQPGATFNAPPGGPGTAPPQGVGAPISTPPPTLPVP